MRQESNRSGFVGVIVTLAVVVVIAVAGFILYQHQKTRPLASSSVGQPSQSSASQETMTAQSAQAATQYLNIKEWGVALPLPANIKDAYYVVPTGISSDPDGLPSGIIVGVKSLNANCGAVAADPKGYKNLIGEVVRVPPTAIEPLQNKPYTQLYPNGVTIGSYYYGYMSAIQGKTCAAQSSLKSVDSAFVNAVKGMSKDSSAQ